MMRRGIPSAGTVVKNLTLEDWKWYTLNICQPVVRQNMVTAKCIVALAIMGRMVIGLNQ